MQSFQPTNWPQLIGQLFMVGFQGLEPPSSLLDDISAGQVGGIILFSRNIVNPAQVAALVYQLRAAAPTHYPLLVGIDQEGGRVQRLRHPLAEWPPMRQVASFNNPQLTRQVGQAMGKDLNHLGFNLNFAPVLDVVTSDCNSVIGDRSFGDNAQQVITQALAFAEGLQGQGVMACGKHFPGHGGPVADSHVQLPVDTRSAQILWESDLQPFQAAVQANLPFLMTAHVVYPTFEAAIPGTLSHVLCTEILREQLKFEGILISDDMEMGAIANTLAPASAALKALRAGVDLLLFCHSLEYMHQAAAALIEAAKTDPFIEHRIIESHDRISRLKSQLPVPGTIDPENVARQVEAHHHYDLLQKLST